MPGLRFERPNGTFYLFFRVEGLTDSKALAIQTLREAKVGICPGSAFGTGGEDCIRLCFGLDPKLLQEAMQRLVPFLQKQTFS